MIRWVVYVLLVAVLSACAVAPKPVDTTKGSFSRSGRFALNVEEADGSREAVQGGFQWQESPQQLQLDLNNPMGAVLARVVVAANGAALQYPNGEVVYAHSPDALVEQLLGYAIPVAGMRYWLRGQSAAEKEGQSSQPSYLEEDQWRVHLKRYDELGPRLLQMYRTQAQQAISVRVVVDY